LLLLFEDGIYCSNVADVAVRASHSDSILNFSIAALLTSEPHFRVFSDLGVANLVRPKFDLILMDRFTRS
jgi:hypothetical protein